MLTQYAQHYVKAGCVSWNNQYSHIVDPTHHVYHVAALYNPRCILFTLQLTAW